MILNNIINTIRNKQRKNANVWLYIPKKDVSIRLLWNLLFTFAKHGFSKFKTLREKCPNSDWIQEDTDQE